VYGFLVHALSLFTIFQVLNVLKVCEAVCFLICASNYDPSVHTPPTHPSCHVFGPVCFMASFTVRWFLEQVSHKMIHSAAEINAKTATVVRVGILQ
jgi:hypothetical protein